MSYDSRYQATERRRPTWRDNRNDRDDYNDRSSRNDRNFDRNGRDGRDDRGDSSSFLPPRPPSRDFSRGGPASLPPRPPPPAPSDSYRPAAYPSRNDDSGRDRDFRFGDRPRNDPLPSPGAPRAHDNYRLPQSDFSFRVEKPVGVQEQSVDSYRPQDGHRSRNGRRGSPPPGGRGPQGRGRRGDNARRGRDSRTGGYQGSKPQWKPFVAAERELLSSTHSTGPTVALFNPENGVTFRSFEELSDSDEAEMDISGDEGDEEPSNKRARLGLDQSAAGNSVPKWSNPDPYTALPPETASLVKKKDVVQLIRKARVQKGAKESLPAETADFISCDFDSSDDDLEVITPVDTNGAGRRDAPGVAGAPTGPRSSLSAQMNGHGNSTLPARPPSPIMTSTKTSESTPRSQVIDLTGASPDVIDLSESPLPKSKQSQTADVLPTPAGKAGKTGRQPSFQDPSPAALGNRKRTYDDKIKLPHTSMKRVNKNPSGGRVTSDWRAIPNEDPCPWIRADHSETPSMGVWLHKEIVDLYDYLKPRDFEEKIRNELVQQLKTFCRNNYRDAEVYPFGSFPSGLYLPTGDLDLVFCSDSYLNGGPPKYNSKNQPYRLKDRLQLHEMAYRNEIECIVHAKVPLVKYVEMQTGLKIDISFENLTGVQAIKTFKAWKEQYPGMPALVTLIKHFLLMRGLNEPVNGGIGGFSVICLVVSMLQQMPQVQSGTMDTRHYLGDLLMEFFDLYGNRFNYQTTAISMHPPKYIPKNMVTSFAYKNYDRFSIIDPNNPENDIAGGSSNTNTIVTLFSEAHRLLSERMAKVAQLPLPERRHASILDVIFAGNYSSFRNQRVHLEKLFKTGLTPHQPKRRAPVPGRW
ncbi:hypothetical protein B0T19DRAFT_101613 [Cercophora scortea]|uniref:polynucleotide adenylyltransferase n=1 Tax=Cercophora scortea TaxID=314031 RepID=A0AAE0IWS8_9PEZI|nr:hypothetical protein B0T19DRAFT_101613 [Cercophora scortea]